MKPAFVLFFVLLVGAPPKTAPSESASLLCQIEQSPEKPTMVSVSLTNQGGEPVTFRAIRTPFDLHPTDRGLGYVVASDGQPVKWIGGRTVRRPSALSYRTVEPGETIRSGPTDLREVWDIRGPGEFVVRVGIFGDVFEGPYQPGRRGEPRELVCGEIWVRLE